MEIVRGSSTPIHIQIAETIVDEIQLGRFLPGSVLPGTRELANKLQLNRKTVVQAYDELISKGWLTTESKRGTFVSSRVLMVSQTSKVSNPLFMPISVNKHRLPASLIPNENPNGSLHQKRDVQLLNLSDDLPDARLIPFPLFSRAMRHATTALSRNNKLHYSDPKGSAILRKAVLNMLNMERGFHTDLEQICIVRGSQMGLFLAARLLADSDSYFVLEQLHNPLARETFKNCGAKLLTVSHNQHGINIDALEKLCINHPVKAIYVTPHHQMPTGVVMPIENRKALLKLAERYQFTIIEDDSGCELTDSKNMPASIASMDSNGHVIYIGSLSKVLAPGFRVGYVVASSSIISQCASDITMMDRQGNTMIENAIAELLHTGEIKRHINKTAKIYSDRKAHLMDLIYSELGDFCTVMPSNSGLGIWLDLATYICPDLLIKDAEKQKIILHCANYYSENSAIFGLRLCFSHLNKDEMTAAILRLKNVFLFQSDMAMSA